MEESKVLDFKFNPTKELLDFADYFSKNYNELSVGDYYSDDKNYHIRYVDKIFENSGIEPNTNLRVGLTSGTIEVSKSKLSQYETNKDYLFFQILWCVINKDVRSNVLSDKIAFEYCLKTGCSPKNIVSGLVGLFKGATTPENMERLEKIKKNIDNGNT